MVAVNILKTFRLGVKNLRCSKKQKDSHSSSGQELSHEESPEEINFIKLGID